MHVHHAVQVSFTGGSTPWLPQELREQIAGSAQSGTKWVNRMSAASQCFWPDMGPPLLCCNMRTLAGWLGAHYHKAGLGVVQVYEGVTLVVCFSRVLWPSSPGPCVCYTTVMRHGLPHLSAFAATSTSFNPAHIPVCCATAAWWQVVLERQGVGRQ